MQTSYKPLVERYDIPRPTLIEWQKRAEQKDNWRVKHLAYLRMQLSVEKETYDEIKSFAPCIEDLFLFKDAFNFFRCLSARVYDGYCFPHDLSYNAF